MHCNGLFKDPPHDYFPKDYSEELGLIEPDPNEVRLSGKELKTQATFLMLAFALVVWIFTYLLMTTITMCFDKNFLSAERLPATFL
ncbi:hypothetical protein HF086_015865 [Spodoptera exigua]|uniref:Uncharacterized protein n=1 Tax=Spodoptera exigua TaxID=7107 RepID=A0A922M451_SPOEX|nr:hypothetical protein HF086_015865 [Spodoptera exigua]